MTQSWPTGDGRRTWPSGTARATAWWSLLRWSVAPGAARVPRPKRDEFPAAATSADEAGLRWPIGRSAPAGPVLSADPPSGRVRYAAGMVSNAVRSIWPNPAPHPPARVWRDWVLVAVLVATAILEGILREDVIWRPVALVLAVALVFPLLRRRTHPLVMVAAAFGAGIAVTVAALVGADGPVGLDTSVYILLFPTRCSAGGPVARP